MTSDQLSPLSQALTVLFLFLFFFFQRQNSDRPDLRSSMLVSMFPIMCSTELNHRNQLDSFLASMYPHFPAWQETTLQFKAPRRRQNGPFQAEELQITADATGLHLRCSRHCSYRRVLIVTGTSKPQQRQRPFMLSVMLVVLMSLTTTSILLTLRFTSLSVVLVILVFMQSHSWPDFYA